MDTFINLYDERTRDNIRNTFDNIQDSMDLIKNSTNQKEIENNKEYLKYDLEDFKKMTGFDYDAKLFEEFDNYIERKYKNTKKPKEPKKVIKKVKILKETPIEKPKTIKKQPIKKLYNLENEKLNALENEILKKYKVDVKDISKLKKEETRVFSSSRNKKLKDFEDALKTYEEKLGDPKFKEKHEEYKFRIDILKKSIDILKSQLNDFKERFITKEVVLVPKKRQTKPKKPSDNIHCGYSKLPKNKRHGTEKECLLKKQIRLYGLNKISDELIDGGFLDFLMDKNKFKSASQKILNQYGNYPIVNLAIYRTPVISVLKSFLNIISFGQFNKATKSFDELFHLAMVATVKLPDGKLKNIIIEKNASPSISTSYKTSDKTEVKNITLPQNKELTINQLVNETLKKIPTERFFVYDAFNREMNSGNCQRFISDILQSNNLMTKEYDEFINQDTKSIVNKLGLFSDILPSTARVITDTANIFGFGKNPNEALHTVIIKDLPFEEAQKIAHDIIKDKKKTFYRITKSGSMRFRNIPKTKFEKKSFRTKKVNKNVSLVFGKLK